MLFLEERRGSGNITSEEKPSSIVPAGSPLLLERYSCVKYLIGEVATTSASLERALFLVPISKSGLLHRNNEGVCKNQRDLLQSGKGISLYNEEKKSFSLHTYILNNQNELSKMPVKQSWPFVRDESTQAHVECLRNCSNRKCLTALFTVSEMPN